MGSEAGGKPDGDTTTTTTTVDVVGDVTSIEPAGLAVRLHDEPTRTTVDQQAMVDPTSLAAGNEPTVTAPAEPISEPTTALEPISEPTEVHATQEPITDVTARLELVTGEVPVVAPLAMIAAAATPLRIPIRTVTPTLGTPMSLTTAADAMRNEEVERTRLFIRMGWLLSVLVIGTVPLVDAPRAMSIVFVVGLVLGMIVSFGFHRAFADPSRYTERSLLLLCMICVFNANVGILYYGTFTATPLMIAVGIHFVARAEADRVARGVFVSAIACYAVIALLIISGAIRDPGVFASDRPISRATLTLAALFVLGGFYIAYHTARTFRLVSLSAIEDLRRETRLASQREAMMDELRAELERALRVGGPGRYTDQTVGQFRLGIVLGRGAMGEVYEAAQVDTGAPCAVKLLRRELLTDRTQVARFLREARASGSFDSPHVVRVLDASSVDASLPFLAMERLQGQTLAEIFRTELRLSVQATLELCAHAASGIDAATAAGIVHRDLKPQNLFRCNDGVWKILDFGIATLSDDTGTLTQGGVVGTPHYMAPEQAQGHRVDGRADLYALAAIAYRCLTGRHPFNASDTPALLYAVVHRMPARPGELAEVTADVDRWFALALAKGPDERFPTGLAMVQALGSAILDELDPKLRRRADALIRRSPWEST